MATYSNTTENEAGTLQPENVAQTNVVGGTGSTDAISDGVVGFWRTQFARLPGSTGNGSADRQYDLRGISQSVPGTRSVGLTAVVCEYNAEVATTHSLILNLLGVDCVIAEDEEALMSLCVEVKPDLVLVDPDFRFSVINMAKLRAATTAKLILTAWNTTILASPDHYDCLVIKPLLSVAIAPIISKLIAE